MTEVEDKPGWTGETITIEQQAAIMLRYFPSALDTILRSLAFLHKDLRLSLEGGGPSAYVETLSENTFFIDCMNSLVDNHEKFGDNMFRMSHNDLGNEAREELRDFVTYTQAMLWIADGCPMPGDEDVSDEEE